MNDGSNNPLGQMTSYPPHQTGIFMEKVLVINPTVEGAITALTERSRQRMIETGDHRDSEAFHHGRHLLELIKTEKPKER